VAEPVELDEQYLETAIRASQILGLHALYDPLLAEPVPEALRMLVQRGDRDRSES